ncbi:MAG: DNA primase [Verrucomicrobia bacterium]|jgi:DNA primase|nr:DNA primase [Verrucomicrobiota bacterium]
MPYFADETLDAVRSIPLYEIVRTQVELSRSGRNWRGLSPFTNEKTPSFFVLTDKNFFKCHSSGLAGDGIRFLQETEKLTFPEAVTALAERFNIPIRYADGKAPDPERRSLRQALFDIYEYARDYYHRAFMADHPEAEAIRRYWTEERGFSLELAETIGIGYAPPQSRKLLDLLQRRDFSTEALAQSGLFHVGPHEQDPGRWWFFFRGRLMIPIRNVQGQVVAFTARQLPQTPTDQPSHKAKYINSPESPVFRKGEMLFNLDRARDAVREAGRFLMVEGQLDALRCWSVGLAEAIAPQGTSTTEEQLKLLNRYCDRLDLLLDSDEAGGRAVLRTLPMAFRLGMEVGVYRLPKGTDPDDFLRANGKEGFRSLARESAVRFAGEALLADPDPSPEARSRALEEVFRILAACPSAVVREGHFMDAVAGTGVPVEAARQDFERFFSNGGPASPSPEEKAFSKNEGTKGKESLTTVEGDLLWAVLQNVEWANSLAQVIDHQWIKIHHAEGKLLSRILAEATVDHLEDQDDLRPLLDSDELRDCHARYFTSERPSADPGETVNQALRFLVRRHCRQRIDLLRKDLANLTTEKPDDPRIADAMREINALTRQRVNGPFPEVRIQSS